MNIETGKKLAELSTFGIGGPADFFAAPTTIDEIREAVAFAKQNNIPYFILGKGSNCLFDDSGYRGLIILNKISFLKAEGAHFTAGAGYSFSLLGTQTARQGYSGLEFASGIPGTVGGAVYMNAGANGKETADTLRSVEYLTESEIVTLPREALEFSYRTSPFQKMTGVILAATFSLTPSKEARQEQIEIISYRTKTQPYGEPSAGCVFRNPVGGHSGKLIEECGLKGLAVGGAVVSPLHANFIVNRGGATQQDVLSLISLLQVKVKEKTGNDLHLEIKVVPAK